jgi:hypothetical protein
LVLAAVLAAASRLPWMAAVELALGFASAVLLGGWLLWLGRAMLGDPDVEIDDLPGQLLVRRRRGWRARASRLATGDIAGLEVRPLPRPLGAHRPWVARFGSLVAATRHGQDILLAECYSNESLAALARELATRLDPTHVSVALPPMADERAPPRPQACSMVVRDEPDGFSVTVPPAAGLLPAGALPAFGAGLALVAVGVFAAFLPVWADLAPGREWAGPACGVALLSIAALVLAHGARNLLDARSAWTLAVRRGHFIVRRQRRGKPGRPLEWRPGEVAAVVVDHRSLTRDGPPVHELVVLDHAARGATLLRARRREDLEWLAGQLADALR